MKLFMEKIQPFRYSHSPIGEPEHPIKEPYFILGTAKVIYRHIFATNIEKKTIILSFPYPAWVLSIFKILKHYNLVINAFAIA